MLFEIAWAKKKIVGQPCKISTDFLAHIHGGGLTSLFVSKTFKFCVLLECLACVQAHVSCEDCILKSNVFLWNIAATRQCVLEARRPGNTEEPQTQWTNARTSQG